MTTSRVTVLGAGNTGVSIAANLSLSGHEVLLWEHPAFVASLDAIAASQVIHLEGTEGTGTAQIAAVTTDVSAALGWSDVLLCSVPSYAHAGLIDTLVPHLHPGHLLALLPGNLGALAFDRALRAAGSAGVIVVESDTAPYVCRKLAPDRAVIWGAVPTLGIGAVPAAAAAAARDALDAFFPGVVAYPSAFVAGLSALNPIVHPPGVLMNAGRIERSRGEFWFYEEGVTPSVVNAILALDAERLAIGRALGIDLIPVATAFYRAGFGPAGDLWSVINGSRMLTPLRAPGSVNTRWLTEDIPFGLATWANLGAVTGVPTPMMDSLITLAGAVLGTNFQDAGRTLDQLGLADKSVTELAAIARGAV